MTPQSLYRRYRPQFFRELVGQEHVTTALRNAVREDRVGHAYLFSGPRGTGKTTTARLLAKALNCLSPLPDGEPCGTCENCAAIAAGTFYDLVELDAASRRGIEDARDLVSSVRTGLGATARRKVYVVDEVHMLTDAASNTLLKTLEEPPDHVVFVLATTDPQKVLPTIRSRTQHFDFTLLSHDQLVHHLTDVLGREGVEAETEAVDTIARRAAGSARDALSLLDQALALGGGRLDTAQVVGTFGGTPLEQRLAVLDAVAAEDPAGALVAVAAALAAGSEPRRLADDLLQSLRDAFVLHAAAGRVPHDGPAEDAARLTALAEALGRAAIVRAIETLGEAIVDIRGPAAPDPRLVLEVAVVRLARREARGAHDALVERVERLERQVAELREGAPARPAPAPAPAPPVPGAPGDRPALGAHRGRSAPAAAAPPSAPEAPEAPAASGEPGEPAPPPAAPAPPDESEEPAAPLDLDDVIAAWPDALAALRPPLRAAVQDAQPIGVERGDVIVFGVPPKRIDGINKRFQAEADTIRAALAAPLGRPPRFRLRGHDFGVASPEPAPAAVPAAAPVPPPDDDIDLADLVDATDAPPPVDSTARLVETFGATVVEERPREQ